MRIPKQSHGIEDTVIVLVVVTDWINNWVQANCDDVKLIYKLELFNCILNALGGVRFAGLYLDNPTLSKMMPQWV